MAETYPHLGWDPAPGSPAEIAALQKKLTASASSLGTVYRLIDRLLGESAAWKGEAANAFRTSLDGELPRYLRNAHRSLVKAAAQLDTWHDDLVGYQATARAYEARAALHQSALARAEAHESAARANPDRPADDLTAAAAAVTDAREALASVRKLARELEETHRVEAGRIAKGLDEATDRLAPSEPGALAGALNWAEDHLGDGLSTSSAALGLAAIFATPGALVPLLFIGAGLSLAALGAHATDPKIQSALKAGFTKGQFDGRFWAATATLTGDSLGAVPGVAAVAAGAKGAVVAVRAAGAAEEGFAAGLHQGARTLGVDSVHAMRTIDQAPKPLVDWSVRQTGARLSERQIQAGFAGTGVTTSTAGLFVSEDNTAVKNTGTVVDGTRMGTYDVPNYLRAARTWAQAR